MDMVTYRAARQRLTERERGLQTELASLPLPDTAPVDVDAVRASWNELTSDERRELLSIFLAPGEIIVRRAERGASRRGVDVTARVRLPESWNAS